MRLSFRPKLFGEAVQAVMALLSEWLAWDVRGKYPSQGSCVGGAKGKGLVVLKVVLNATTDGNCDLLLS
jgi:hypothetical protein